MSGKSKGFCHLFQSKVTTPQFQLDECNFCQNVISRGHRKFSEVKARGNKSRKKVATLLFKDRACYGAFVANVFKYLGPNFVSRRPA